MRLILAVEISVDQFSVRLLVIFISPLSKSLRPDVQVTGRAAQWLTVIVGYFLCLDIKDGPLRDNIVLLPKFNETIQLVKLIKLYLELLDVLKYSSCVTCA